MSLIDSLIKEGWLKTPKIIDAFQKIKREDFLPDNLKDSAEVDAAMPIGFGQTISQPLTVAFMLELLQPKEGDKILDVGSGSGWTTALLAYIVSQKGNSKSEILNPKQIQNTKSQILNGKVVALEIVPELKKIGEENATKYNFVKKGIAKFVLGDGSKGYKDAAPYDKILSGASGNDLPLAWKKQLKIDGRIVCPIETSIWLFVKKTENNFESMEYPGFVFVPLIENR